MSGFEIQPQDMRDVLQQYGDICAALNRECDELRGALSLLQLQQGCCDTEILALRAAIAALEAAAGDLRELSGRGRMVAEVYERAEQQAARIVSTLPTAELFGPTGPDSSGAGTTSGAPAVRRGEQINIQTTYRSVEPLLAGGNALPHETWLWERLRQSSDT